MILTFGKYKGKELKQVARLNPSYAIWFVKRFNYKMEVYQIADEIMLIANNCR